jgi:hypothetical protein
MIQAWCDLRGCTTTFTKHASSTLQSLDDLGISWMVCVPYTGSKLGGWISENYLALARLNYWFYSMLSTVVTEYQFIEPQTPQQYWTMKKSLGWLKVRDLSRGAAKMNAKELIQLVHDYMTQVGGPPPMKQDIGGNVANIEFMLESLSTMIAACMQSEYTEQDIVLLDLKIKVFFSYFANFDDSMKCRSDVVDIGTSSGPNFTEPNKYNEDGHVMHAVNGDDDDDDEEDDDAVGEETTGVSGMKKKKKEKPKWFMSYSFICLTNLPDLIRRYGPLRLYWEGGGLGEKVLQQLKLLWLGFRKNWQESTLKDIYQQGELTMITEELRNEKKNYVAKMFHIYIDYITARNTLLQKNQCH